MFTMAANTSQRDRQFLHLQVRTFLDICLRGDDQVMHGAGISMMGQELSGFSLGHGKQFTSISVYNMLLPWLQIHVLTSTKVHE